LLEFVAYAMSSIMVAKHGDPEGAARPVVAGQA
jgi:hypothetical protein